MSTDTHATIEIGAAPLRMLGLALLGAAFTVISGAIALGYLGDQPPESFARFMCWVGLVFFGLCTVLILWRLATGQGTVVTLSREGIQDKRVAAEMIPWSAIRSISTWSSNGQRIMVLDVDPAVEKGLTLTRIARWSRGANRSLGADGLCISAQGLRIGFDDLLAHATARAEHAQRR